MSKAFNEYKNCYSRYIDLAVKAHNYHLAFIAHGGDDTGNGLRRCMRQMKKIEAQMIRLSRLAFKEVRENKKEIREKSREAYLAWKKANPPKIGRPKGSKTNVKHNRTDQNSP
jgi:hypothetical protein